MNWLGKWLGSMGTSELIQMFVQLSAEISALRDKPFCTIRQMEELSNTLDLDRIAFKLIYEELQGRTMTEDEMKQFNDTAFN